MYEQEQEQESEINENDYGWIKRFDEEDKCYSDFYAENLTFIQLRMIYVNKSGEINKLKTEKHILIEPNCLTRNEILRIIKHNCIENDVKYSILSILKYNITLSPVNLKSFLKSNDKYIGTKFLTLVRNIDAIHFEQTITMLQDLNELLIFFYIKPDSKSESTNQSQSQSQSHNVTKKIIFTPALSSSAHKKTLKKQFKENE
jgi:hypothetical protein